MRSESSEGMTSFERELESELHRLLDPMKAGQAVPTRRVVARPGRGLRKLLGGAGAAIGVKVATGFAVAAVAATAAAAATEVATTGSLSPADWGQHVSQQVATCKSELAAGQSGIGACVSTFANQHGAAPAGPRQASPARASENGNAQHDDATVKPKDKNEGSNSGAGGNGNGNGNSGHDDKSEKAKSPVPGTSRDREPTDPPMVSHINLPPPPP
jgi:hypothetical protein